MKGNKIIWFDILEMCLIGSFKQILRQRLGCRQLDLGVDPRSTKSEHIVEGIILVRT